MKSKLFNLNRRDFFKGLVVAILTAIITFLTDILQSGVVIDIDVLKRVAVASVIGFLSYILKNMLTNSEGQILTPEK